MRILIMAKTRAEAEVLATEARLQPFAWEYLEYPMQLAGWQEPRIVVQDGCVRSVALMDEANARNAVFYSEFDLLQGRIR